jgi:hypothetical protein
MILISLPKQDFRIHAANWQEFGNFSETVEFLEGADGAHRGILTGYSAGCKRMGVG